MLGFFLSWNVARFPDQTKLPTWHVRQCLEGQKKFNRCAPSTGSYCGVGKRPSDMRMVLEAIFHIMRGGYPWRVLPARSGPRKTVYGRFSRFCKVGFFEKLLLEVAKGAKGKLRFLDGSYIRVRQDGAPPFQLAGVERVGTSELKGRNSRVHAVVDLLGRAIRLIVIPGNIHDISAAPEIVAEIQQAIIVAEKGYDSKALRTLTCKAGNRTSIPKRAGAKNSAPFNSLRYRKRHRVEKFFDRIKRYRRIATHYEKNQGSCEGFLLFAAILDWFR